MVVVGLCGAPAARRQCQIRLATYLLGAVAVHHRDAADGRSEGQRRSGESAHTAAYIAVKRKLIDNLLANLRSRFPRMELLNVVKVRLRTVIVLCIRVVCTVLA